MLQKVVLRSAVHSYLWWEFIFLYIYVSGFQATICVRRDIISSLVSHKLVFIGIYFLAISEGNDLITD